MLKFDPGPNSTLNYGWLVWCGLTCPTPRAAMDYPNTGTGTSEDAFLLLAIREPTRGEGKPGIEPGLSDPQSSPLSLHQRGGHVGLWPVLQFNVESWPGYMIDPRNKINREIITLVITQRWILTHVKIQHCSVTRSKFKAPLWQGSKINIRSPGINLTLNQGLGHNSTWNCYLFSSLSHGYPIVYKCKKFAVGSEEQNNAWFKLNSM